MVSGRSLGGEWEVSERSIEGQLMPMGGYCEVG